MYSISLPQHLGKPLAELPEPAEVNLAEIFGQKSNKDLSTGSFSDRMSDYLRAIRMNCSGNAEKDVTLSFLKDEDVLAFAQLQSDWSLDPEEGHPIVALNSDRWRLVYDARLPERPQLFDKETDPRELRNLAAQEPEIVEELLAKVQSYLERTDAPWGEAAPVIEIDDMQLLQLRAIGYGGP